MAALPYMQLYVADYLADTAYLDVIESGAYLHLLMNYWQTGKPLPNNDKKLARISKCSDEQWSNVRSTVIEFFIERDDVLIHNRVEKDLASIAEKQSKAAAAGKASGKARRKNGNLSSVEHPLNERSMSVERLHEQSLNHKDTDTNTDPDPDPDTDPDTDTESKKYKKGPSSADAFVDADKPDKKKQPVDNNIPRDLIMYFNEITGKNFKQVETHHALIRARLNEGHTVDEIKSVIRMKHEEWKDTRFEKFIDPQTIFKASKFNKYVGNVEKFEQEESGIPSWLEDEPDYIEGEIVNDLMGVAHDQD